MTETAEGDSDQQRSGQLTRGQFMGGLGLAAVPIGFAALLGSYPTGAIEFIHFLAIICFEPLLSFVLATEVAIPPPPQTYVTRVRLGGRIAMLVTVPLWIFAAVGLAFRFVFGYPVSRRAGP